MIILYFILSIYRLSAQIISRTKKEDRTKEYSVVAAAAYRAGEKIKDERTGKTHDYRNKTGVDGTVILAPLDAPDWVFDRTRLFNKVESTEKRIDSQLAREIQLAIPRELSEQAKTELVIDFVKDQFVSRGMVADVAFHQLNSHQPHAHVLLTMRELKPDGFGYKVRDWNGTNLLNHWRAKWANHANRALAKEGIAERIDHRTLEAQGKERIPQSKNRAVLELEKRGTRQGIEAEAGELYQKLKKQYGDKFRLGKADWVVSRIMLGRGHSPELVTKALSKVRPDAKPEYLKRTVQRAAKQPQQERPYQHLSKENKLKKLASGLKRLVKEHKERAFMRRVHFLYATHKISKKTYQKVLETNQKWQLGQERYRNFQKFQKYSHWLYHTGRMSYQTYCKINRQKQVPKTRFGAYALYATYKMSKRELNYQLKQLEKQEKERKRASLERER